ncbi:hypothetical protein [Sphingobium herbicidovorans]|uniref:hypothetical protein n=1 Tax=Sphingobium herbicidovorans TaxID=76947 RepID=UPI0012E039C6|nr:hypothetical protein [Sphingobium herbicidovorans]
MAVAPCGLEGVVAIRGRRRVPVAAVVQSLSQYLGETGARLYVLREFISGAILATAATLYLEHIFLGPNPAAILADEPVPLAFWRYDWSHEGEKTESKLQGRNPHPERTSITADWAASSFAIVMTWGTPERGLRMCKRASGVSIAKSDYDRLLEQFHCSQNTDRSPVSQADVVRWCADWLTSGRGRNSASAYAQFAADPRFDDVAREAFRAAWAEAKIAQNG